MVFCLAASAQASRRHELDWPTQYQELALCEIPVYMELPGFAKVLNKDDLEISLDDVSFGTFQGCTDFELIAMIDITLGCKVKGNRKVRGDYSCSIDNPQVPATGSTPEIRKVCVKLENAKFYYFATSPDERVQVATLTLTVSAR